MVRRVAELRLRHTKAFIPGETPVPYAGRVYDAEELVNLVDSSLEFWLTAGRYTREFESSLARWYGRRHALFVNSGSSANLAATSALTSDTWGARRVASGDEVITVAAGFPTTVAPLIQCGAVPVFCDVTLPGYNLDVEALEEARSPRTRAVALAHTLGNPFDVDAVQAFCRRHDLWLLEDNCDAAGSLYRGKKTGTFGDVSTLSFYPPHHMTTGEGGAVLCDDRRMDRVLGSFRDWGRDCWCEPGNDNTCGKRFDWQLGELPAGYDHKYIFTHLGFNLKATDMQAAIGLAQIGKLDQFGRSRRENWTFFRTALAEAEEFLVLPEPTEGSDPSWFGFALTVRRDAPFQRGDLVRELESRKIQTRMLFSGNLVRQPALVSLLRERSSGSASAFRSIGRLATTDWIMESSFWVGVYPGMTVPMRAFVAEVILEFIRKRTRGK